MAKIVCIDNVNKLYIDAALFISAESKDTKTAEVEDASCTIVAVVSFWQGDEIVKRFIPLRSYQEDAYFKSLQLHINAALS